LYRGFGVPRLALIEDLTAQPVPAGLNIYVEFDPASQWYNASFTITAGWIRSGGVGSYNVYNHTPGDARSKLKRLGLDVETLEREEKLRIIDWYTFQLGQKSKEKYAFESLKVADQSIITRKMLTDTGSLFPGTGYRLGPDVLRIDDDDLVMLRFNDEKSFIDYWRLREIPVAAETQSSSIYSLPKGVYSESLYKNLETSADGIIDFKIDEEGGEVRSLMRIRSMQSVSFDSRWHRLKIGDNFEVTLEK